MLLPKLSLLLFLVGFVSLAPAENAPRVRTPLGAVKGYYKVSQNGRQYEAFEGIPYALPPIGKLRFKPPHKLPPWIGELQATKFGAACLQYDQVSDPSADAVIGAEDCLYLNVYVPVRENVGNLRIPSMPVIFWIHGGAFQFGSGMYAGAKFLMDRDVVLVTINYRLGPLGFLSTEDEIVPGNMGLKDQNMALRWVSENIEWFGGNPQKITLVGLSAGGASVHYQYLSPLSAGLFQGGISISGTALDCWTQARNSLEKTKKLAALMGCPTISTREMVQCLKFRPARAMVQAVKEYQVFYYNPFTPFGPVAEKFGDAPFIDRPPAEIIDTGDVQDIPWVTGVTSEEGLWPVAEFMMKDESLKQLEDNWDLLAPSIFFYNYTIPTSQQLAVSKLIKQHYFGNKPIDKNTLKPLINLASDRFFIVDSEKAARLQAKVNKQPVWYYYFSYRGAQSLSEYMSGSKENFGVSHADDAYYVVDTPYMDGTTTQSDREMQQRLIDFWVSFAKDGVPNFNNAKWSKLDPTQKELQYLHISGPQKGNMDVKANLGEKDFWNSIGFDENQLSVTPKTGRVEL